MLNDMSYACRVRGRCAERDVEDFIIILRRDQHHAGSALFMAKKIPLRMYIGKVLCKDVFVCAGFDYLR
jgi:hypothetical protein